MPTYDLLGLQVFVPDLNDLSKWIVGPIQKFLSDAWSFGGAIYNTVVEAITKGLNAFFGAAGDFLKNITAEFTKAMTGFFTQAGAFFSTISATVYNALVATAGTIWQQILDVGKGAFDIVTNLAKDLGDATNQGIGQLWGFATSTYESILKSLSEIEFFVVGEFKYWVGEAANFIINSLQGIGQGIGQVQGQFVGFFQQLSNDLDRGFANLALDSAQLSIQITQSSDQTIIEMREAVAQGLGAIWDGFKAGVIDPIYNSVTSALAGLATELGAIWDSGGTFLSGVAQFFGGIWDAIVGWFSNFLNPSKAGIFADPLAFIFKALSGFIGVFGGFGIAMTAAELAHPIKNLGLTRLAAYINEMGDFKNMAGGIIQALQNKTTIIPLEQALNVLFRPFQPDIQTSNTWLFKGIIDIPAWRQVYAMRGWSDDLIEKYYRDIWTEPSDRMLIALADTPGVSEEWLGRKIAARGYDPVDTELFRRYIQKRRLADEFAKLISSYRTAFVKGYVNVQQFTAIVQITGRSKEEADWMLESASRDADTARLNEDIDILVQAFRTGKLDAASFERNLQGLPLVPERQANILEKEIARKKVLATTEKALARKNLTESQILAAYKAGILDVAETKTRLITLNYAIVDADILIATTDAAS